MLDALDAVGFRGDGRILQLNSYENRVFQVMLEDGGAVVAKFYRRARWSDAQIVEEHSFALELAEAEVPVVAPCLLGHAADGVRLLPEPGPATLALRPGPNGVHRYSVSPRQAGRSPELEDDAVLVRLGGFIGRLHAVGARRPFAHRRTLDAPRDAREAVALLLDGGFVSDNQRDNLGRGLRARHRLHRRRLRRARAESRSACTATATPATCCGAMPARTWSTWTTPAWARPCRTCGCCCRASPRRWRGSCGCCCAATRRSWTSTAPSCGLIEPLRLLRMIRHNAWVAQRWQDPAFPRAFPDFGSSGYWGQQALQLREQLRVAAENAQPGRRCC